MGNMTLSQKLVQIQTKLKSPKDKKNKFGDFNYRSAEGIYEVLKPLLKEYGLALILTDSLAEVAGVPFVCANAILTDESGASVTTIAYAGVEKAKKGMDISQTTGSASSYARKYALGGMFLIDDSKADPDSMDNETLLKEAHTEKAIEDGYATPAMIKELRSFGVNVEEFATSYCGATIDTIPVGMATKLIRQKRAQAQKK